MLAFWFGSGGAFARTCSASCRPPAPSTPPAQRLRERLWRQRRKAADLQAQRRVGAALRRLDAAGGEDCHACVQQVRYALGSGSWFTGVQGPVRGCIGGAAYRQPPLCARSWRQRLPWAMRAVAGISPRQQPHPAPPPGRVLAAGTADLGLSQSAFLVGAPGQCPVQPSHVTLPGRAPACASPCPRHGCRRAAHWQQVQARARFKRALSCSSHPTTSSRLGRKIGSGSFGDIYLGASRKSNSG